MPLNERDIEWDAPTKPVVFKGNESNIKWDVPLDKNAEAAAKSYIEQQIIEDPSLKAQLDEGKSYSQMVKRFKDFEAERTGETNPWLDPTIAFSGGFGGAGKMALSRGATPIGAAIKGFLGGTTAAATEPISGGLAGEVAEKYPRAALPVNLIAGGLLGAGLEAPLERIISRTAGRALPKVAAKIAPKAPVLVKAPKEADIKWDKIKAIEEPSTSTPQKLSEALGKPNEVETLKKMGITGEKAQIDQIANDAVRDPLNAAKAFEKRGDMSEASQIRGEAIENAEILRKADGIDTDKAVNRALGSEDVGKSLGELKLKKEEDARIRLIEKAEGIETQGEVAMLEKMVPVEKGILESTIGDIASEEGALTLMKTPIRDAMEVQKTPTVTKVQSVFDEQRSAVESVNKMKPKEWLGRLNRAIVDVSGNAKNTLIKKAGKEGQKAVMEHDLIAGASAKANLEVGEVIDSMTKGLKKEQYEYMNDFIQAKRAIAISKYKKDFKHAGGIEAKEYAEWIEKNVMVWMMIENRMSILIIR